MEVVNLEYIKNNGTKIIVEGDEVQYEAGKRRKNIIGANFSNGVSHGGYLSSFNGLFSDEQIGIESGIGDVINAKIGDIKNAYKLLKAKIDGNRNADVYELSRLVLETVDEFFGGHDNIDDRINYYYPDDFEESKDNRISALEGSGAAMCVERSALAQNLLKSLGINSFFKTSGILKNGNKEVHSYNLVELRGKYYIFDSSIPTLINNRHDPLIAEIDKETFSLLSSPLIDVGISVTVTHYNPYRNEEVTICYDSGREKSIECPPLAEKERKHI